jgi:diguanylate cyclase (GGDEF)-like protein
VNADKIKVLLVEDTLEYAELLEDILSSAGATQYQLKHVTNLGAGLDLLSAEPFGLILLDLNLPDSRGYDTFVTTYKHSPGTPIVILTALDDDRLALKAVREGAQDYLDKGQINSRTMLRALRYAVERQRQREVLQQLSMIDDLTGLYNRRGFLMHGGKYLKLAERTKRCMLVLFADVDGLKDINDQFGHQEGDKALVEIARLIKSTFRESDIVARIGGDEFAILALDIPEKANDIILKRLYGKLEMLNSSPQRRYQLCLSVGTTTYLHERPRTLEELLSMADMQMYKQKHRKTNSLDD